MKLNQEYFNIVLATVSRLLQLNINIYIYI